MKDLVESGLIRRIKVGVKLLAKGADQFNTPINIEVSHASKLAEECVLNAGGKLTRVYFTRLGLKALLKVWLVD